jgi:hypothetical protein
MKWQITELTGNAKECLISVKILIEVFYVVMPCSDVVEYHRFRRTMPSPCTLELEDGGSVVLRNTTRRYNAEDLSLSADELVESHSL